MKRSGFAVGLVLALSMGFAGWAEEEVRPPEPAAEDGAMTEGSSASPAGEQVELEALLGLRVVPAPQSCQEVCTSFFAPNHGDCSDLNCYSRGCGAPNYWDPMTCYCYCSYCF